MAVSGLGSYLDGLEADRAAAMRSLLGTIREHIDPRFAEAFDGQMVHWVVSSSDFRDGYHVTPGQPVHPPVERYVATRPSR